MVALAGAWTDGQGDPCFAPAGSESDGSAFQSGNHAVLVDPRVARVRSAMEPGVMSIVFQPVIDLRLGRIAGAEALARFATTPVRTPDLWFNEAWEVGLGVELELIAIRQALASLGSLPEGCHLAINASPETLVSPLLDAVLDGFPGDRLIVELTEHAQVDDYSNVKTATERLRARGIRLAIDDAGAGFSSLQHILHLRPDLIKLDRSLTQGIDGDPVRYALAAALVTFALSLEAEICAEGIEKDAELAALQHLGIAYGQGYFLGRPRPLPLAAPPKGVWLSGSTASVQHVRTVRPLRPACSAWSDTTTAPSLLVVDADRVAALESPELLDAAAVEGFDRITRWASLLLRAPIAVFSLIDDERQCFKSSVGLPDSLAAKREMHATRALCHHVLAANGPLVIADALAHPRLPDDGLVTRLGAAA